MANISIYNGDRSALMPLFALADDSPFQVSSYRELGTLLVARDGEEVMGCAQIIELPGAAAFELKCIAVCRCWQRTGIGRDLIRAVIRYCQQHNVHRLIVSTAAADTGNLRFYQRQGFRLYQIVQDAFVPSKGYAEGIMIDGIPLRDQVLLELNLTQLPGSPLVEAPSFLQ